MNSRTTAIVAALGVLAVAIGVAITFTSSQTSEGTEEFSPYASTNSATNGANNPAAPSGAKSQNDKSKPDSTASAKPSPEDHGMLKLPHDELNRPGPTGAAAEARRIKNRRARGDDEEPGRQDGPPKGSLDKEDVQKGIQAVRPLLKVCYEDTLEEFPDAAGKVTLGFRIIGEGGEGRVEMTELDDEGTTLFDQKLHDCLQKTIGDAEFETPSGGGVVDVRYPFVFKSDAEE